MTEETLINDKLRDILKKKNAELEKKNSIIEIQEAQLAEAKGMLREMAAGLDIADGCAQGAIYVGMGPLHKTVEGTDVQLFEVRNPADSGVFYASARDKDLEKMLKETPVGQRVLLHPKNGHIVGLGPHESKGLLAKVIEVFEDGSLDLETFHETHVLAKRSTQLRDVPLKNGNRVVYNESSGIALWQVSDYDRKAHKLAPVLDKTFDDIGGMDETKKRFTEMFQIYFLRREDMGLLDVPIMKGALLYGPAGCGKTTIAKAITRHLDEFTIAGLERLQSVFIAQDAWHRGDKSLVEKIYHEYIKKAIPAGEYIADHLDFILRSYGYDPQQPKEGLARVEHMLAQDRKSAFLFMNGPDLLDKWVGNNEANLRHFFSDAREKAKECGLAVGFLDECEGVFRRRGIGDSSSGYLDNIVATFNSQMNGLEDNENVFIILASNLVENIDPAVLRDGRVDMRIKVDRPDRASAVNILEKYFKPTTTQSFMKRYAYDSELVKRFGDDGARREYINICLDMIFAETEENKLMKVTYEDGRSNDLYMSNLISGAMLENIAKQAKFNAIVRSDGRTELTKTDLEKAFNDVRDGHRHIQSQNILEELGKYIGRRIKKADIYNPSETKTDWAGR